MTTINKSFIAARYFVTPHLACISQYAHLFCIRFRLFNLNKSISIFFSVMFFFSLFQATNDLLIFLLWLIREGFTRPVHRKLEAISIQKNASLQHEILSDATAQDALNFTAWTMVICESFILVIYISTVIFCSEVQST